MKIMSPTASIHDALSMRLTSEQIFTIAGLLKKLLNQIPIDEDIQKRVTKPPKDFKMDPNQSFNSSVDGLKMSTFSLNDSDMKNSFARSNKKAINKINSEFIGNFIGGQKENKQYSLKLVQQGINLNRKLKNTDVAIMKSLARVRKQPQSELFNPYLGPKKEIVHRISKVIKSYN